MKKTIKTKDFISAMLATGCARAQENTRYSINGVAFISDDNGVRLAATDGRRLHEYVLQSSPCELRCKHVLTTEQALNVLSLASDSESLTITADETLRFSVCDDIPELEFVLSDFKFPNYANVVPIPTDDDWYAGRDPMLNAMRIISDMAEIETGRYDCAGDEITNTPRVLMDFSGGLLRLTPTGDAYCEDPVAVIPISITGKRRHTVLFNPELIADALECCPTHQVRIGMRDCGDGETMAIRSGTFTAAVRSCRR